MQTSAKGDGIYIHCLLVWEYVDPITVEESKPDAYQQPNLIYEGFLESSPSVHTNEASDPSRSDQPGVYVPIAMCIETHEALFGACKEVMVALYNHYQDCCSALRDSELKHLIANTEFARNACFILNDLFVPPPECKINVKIGQYSVMHTADELDRLPHSEDCIKVLFTVLDISNIILLWKSLLLEKHVVIMSNSKYMCFNICEGIKALMFPLKWSFNYTPILPKSMTDYLEAIFPTIFGVLSTVVSFDEVKKLSPNATIIDIDTQNSSSDDFELFCPRIEDQLRMKLQSLKLSEYNRLEQANVKCVHHNSKNFVEATGTESDCTMQVRQAFLQVFVDAFSNLSSCFTFNSDKNEYEVNPEIFLSALPECPGDHECKTFWKSLIESEHFIQFCLSKYSLEHSYFNVFEGINKNHQTKKECPVYTMTSCLHPKAMYNSIWQILKKSPSVEPEKVHKFLKSSAEIFFSKNQEDISNHHYFEDPESLCTPRSSSPRVKHRPLTAPPKYSNFAESASKVQACVEMNFFYGSNGLYKYMRTLFGFMHETDFRQLSDNELLIQSLEDAPQNWQTHLVRASAYLSHDTNGEQVIEELVHVSEQNDAAMSTRILIGVLPRLRAKMLQTLRLRDDRIGKTVKFYIENKRPDLGEGSDSESDDKYNESITELPPTSSRRTRRFKTYMLPGQEAGALFSYKVKVLNERPWTGQSQSAVSLSGNLLNKLVGILHNQDFNLISLNLAGDFHRLTNDLSGLQLATLSSADSRLESMCAYMNLFNVCLLHSLIEKNLWPRSRYEWNTQMRKSFYIINGCQCSVYELIDAILNLGTNETLETDAYPYGKLELSEPLAAFGYFIPVGFSPKLRSYTNPATVISDLKDNAAALLRTTTLLSAEGIIKLPALIKYYGRLFGDSDLERLTGLQKYMDDGTKDRAKEAVRGNYRIEYEEFDWSMSFTAV